MAQTNYTPISLYYSTTASAVPTAANLVPGELAINTNDGKLYYEDSSGVVQVLASKAGALGDVVGPASATDNALARFDLTTGKLIQNSVGILSDAGVLTGLTGLTSSGSITLSSLTSGRVTYAGASGLLTDSANLLYSGTDLTVYGVRVGRGGGAISTNTAVGASALAANTTGADNTALGLNALASNTTGINNTASGRFALTSNTTGTGNTASGYSSLATNIAGNYNTASGGLSLYSNTGSNNTAIGYDALNNNTTASNNTAVGYQAGYAITTGTNNVCFGAGAGYGSPVGGTDLTTGQFNTLIGAVAYTSGANDSSSIVIGFNTAGKGSSTGFINPNSGGVYQGNNSTLWSITSDQRLKKNIVDNNTGLDKITSIQVRNFEYRLPEEITEVSQDQAINKQGVQLGVIAQEFQKILPECVKTESTGVMTVDADNLTWYMINAIKELKAEIDSLKQQLASK
jgi:hypothetical protein